MNNPSDFKLTVEAILVKLPPGREVFRHALQAMCDYTEQSDLACSSEHSQRGRVRLLERAQVALIQKLESLCDTELPDDVADDQVRPGEKLSKQRSRSRPKGGQ